MRTRLRALWSLTNSNPLWGSIRPLSRIRPRLLLGCPAGPHPAQLTLQLMHVRLRSAVVSPFLRSLPSISACFIQRRIAVADGSNSFVNRSGLCPARTNSTIRALNSGPYLRPPSTLVTPPLSIPVRHSVACQRRASLPGRGLQRPRHSLETGEGVAMPGDRASPISRLPMPTAPTGDLHRDDRTEVKKRPKQGFRASERSEEAEKPALRGASRHPRGCPRRSGPHDTAAVGQIWAEVTLKKRHPSVAW